MLKASDFKTAEATADTLLKLISSK